MNLKIMTTTAGIGAMLVLLTACDEPLNRGTVKSLHGEGTSRPYVVCQEGSTYREVNLSEAILKQIKVGDTCPTWEMPYATTTTETWRR